MTSNFLFELLHQKEVFKLINDDIFSAIVRK